VFVSADQESSSATSAFQLAPLNTETLLAFVKNVMPTVPNVMELKAFAHHA